MERHPLKDALEIIGILEINTKLMKTFWKAW